MNRNTLLIVDDMEVNRAILRGLFKQEYNLLEAENGEQALMLIRQYRETLAAVLLDLIMPVKDGYQVMTEMTQSGLSVNIPVIVITSENSMENEVHAFDLGAADIILKPFEPHVVRRRVQNVIDLNRHRSHLEEMVEEQAAKLRESRDVIMDTLSSVIEHRSAETGQHVLRIRMFTKVLLQDVARSCPEYELSERSINVIAEAAALHDIGKISIPDTILNKPGRLTAEEFDVMKTHTIKGCEILSGLDRMGDEEYLRYAYNICRYHHERWDGCGYPEGLKGDNTPVCAQAVGVADAFDALTTDRVYKQAIQPEQALTMILNGECGLFSPKLLECLKNVRNQFFDLVHEYADGHSPQANYSRLPASSLSQKADAENTLEFGQMKYFTMLRYTGSTVMEVDMASGIYHVVYQQNEDFEDLRSGGTFEDSYRAFIENSAHPDDRTSILETLESYIHDFFSRGLIKRSRTYRVLHRTTGEYVWYETTLLRVDIDHPQSHKALIIWKELDTGPAPLPLAADASITQEVLAGIVQCLNDNWFTIRYVNKGFVTMFGYGQKDIAERFNNRFIEMIHPADRLAVRRCFLNQLTVGSAQELEYRILTKDGRIVWVLDKCRLTEGDDGQEYLNVVLTDITQIKQAQEELRLTMERYRIIQDQTNDILFEGDLATETVVYSPNWEKKFGNQPICDHILSKLQTASHLFPEDVSHLVDRIREIQAGASYGEIELRIANADGRYLWCRVRMTTQFNDEKKPVRVVGVIMDIDTEKRRIQELADKARQDMLTHLYNKATAQEKIRHRLEQRDDAGPFTMLIIDLDNFKQVNDKRGHMFGDAVLAEVASRLKSLYGIGEIVARFGGDEFLAFISSAADEKFLREKAYKTIELIRNVYLDETQNIRLTCSVGIACCPKDGTSFETLFEHCDRALYYAKHHGKDGLAVYDDAVMAKTFGRSLEPVSAAGTRIESDDMEDFSIDSMVPQAFQKLYESGDVEATVNAILEMVGQRYNVSRVYIFEDSQDGAYSCNTFEWCNEGIQPEIEHLQHVLYQELGGGYRENFNENGIFYCPDISALPQEQYDLLAQQGIRSVLQCAVRDGQKFVGFVGFDDCAVQRLWTQNQIDALTFIAEFLSTFLLKRRAQERAEAAVRDLRMALDNQNSWIYVIDPDNYDLKYINAKTQHTVPGARVGMRCYEAFFHRESPCERCPAANIRRLTNQTLEIYNPVLDIWSLADASLIRWGNREACLLACQNITQYKSGGHLKGDALNEG